MDESLGDGVRAARSQQEDGCGKGHRPSLLLQTGPGGRICLPCVSGLISDKNAILIHRTYAIEQLSMALGDDLFCSELLDRHPQFLVTPLCEAIGSSTDTTLAEDITNVILNMCSLSENLDSLLQDFIWQIARQIAYPYLWTPSKFYTLHLMGILLDLHGKQELTAPQGIKNQRDFVPNLLSGLQLAEDKIRAEILYVLYKVACLEDSMAELLRYALPLCHISIRALLQTENDVLRSNCIALFTVMAQRSVFDIGLGDTIHDDADEVVNSDDEGSKSAVPTSFARTFAEGMKGSLLSSDPEVRASALRLICLVFPDGQEFQKEMQILVEEGIVDYAFEIMRLSENQQSIQILAVDVLILLSATENLFWQRIKFGLETLTRALEKTVNAPCDVLQISILNLLCGSLLKLPGLLSTIRAEHLLLVLTKSLQSYSNSLEDCAEAEDRSLLPPAFTSTCLALISLSQAPCCRSISNFHRTFRTAVTSAVVTATSKANEASDPSNLQNAACLLRALYEVNKMEGKDGVVDDDASETLVNLCERRLLPAFTDQVQNFDDEILVVDVLQTFTIILKCGPLESSYHFASTLASNKYFSLSFELMGRFPSRHFQQCTFKFLSALIDKLACSNMDDDIEEAIPHLPGDPSGLLIMLGQRIAKSHQVVLAHHAIIAILSTSHSFNDRLANDVDVMASLEQHLLVNHGSALVDGVAPSMIVKHFVCIYATVRWTLSLRDSRWSAQAEGILELIVQSCNCKSTDFFNSDTPKPVLRWFLQRESLRDLSMVQIFTWFTTLQTKSSAEQEVMSVPTRERSESQYLLNLAELIGEENCGTTLLIALFDKVVAKGMDDGIIIVARTIMNLARMSVSVGYQLVRQGFIRSIKLAIRYCQSEAAHVPLLSCLGLSFQMLYDWEPSEPSPGVVSYRWWVDIADQCVSIFLEKMKSTSNLEVLAVALNVINLTLFVSYKYAPFQAECGVLLRNSDMCVKIDRYILDFSSQSSKLSQMEPRSMEGELICAAFIFNMLTINRARRFDKQNKTSAYELKYTGLRALAQKVMDSGSGSCRTFLEFEHWCRILYFGSLMIKMLAACCISELLSQLQGAINSTTVDSTTFKGLDLSLNFFTSLTMILQSCVMEDADHTPQIASYCLYQLLCSDFLSLNQKLVIANSPWNYLLLENLVLSFSALNMAQRSGTHARKARTHRFSAAYIAVGLLKMRPPLSYLSSLFSHSSITNIVTNLAEDDIHPIIVSFFHELLLLKYLTNDHVRIVRDLFQVTRQKVYERGSRLHSTNERSKNVGSVCSRILNVDDSCQSIILSALLDLVVTSKDYTLESFIIEQDDSGTSESSGRSQGESSPIISLLDSFLQDSDLQFE